MAFKDIFPGLSTTKLIFQDFPGAGKSRGKIQDFPRGVLRVLEMRHTLMKWFNTQVIC